MKTKFILTGIMIATLTFGALTACSVNGKDNSPIIGVTDSNLRTAIPTSTISAAVMTTDNISPTIEKKEPTVSPTNILNDKDNPTNNETHKILGTSTNLTAKEVSSMDAWRNDIVKFAQKNSAQVYINGFLKDKVISLTFDDGPDSSVTPKILDVLKANNVKASFFCWGDKVQKNPEIVQRIFDEGHLVLNHTYNHKELTKLDEQRMTSEIEQTQDVIFKIIGKRPAIIRPPYGDIDSKVDQVCINSGLKVALWSIDTLDWSIKEKNGIISNATQYARPGDIILMHSCEETPFDIDALKEIINKLKLKGYSFRNVADMLGINAYQDN